VYRVLNIKARTERRNWTELIRFFDELTNGQAVMHYIKHRLTASVTTWLRARMRQPMTNKLALLAHCSVRQKLNRVSSVQFSYVAPCPPLVYEV